MNLFTAAKRLFTGTRHATSRENAPVIHVPEQGVGGMVGSGAAAEHQPRDVPCASVTTATAGPAPVELPQPPSGRHRFGWAAPAPTRLVEADQATWDRSTYFELAILDCSKSMFDAVSGQRRIDILLREVGGYCERLNTCRSIRPCFAVVWFREEAVLGLPWTDRLGDVRNTLPATMPAPGGTNFAAAFRAAVAMLTARPFPPDAQVVVRMYSDGLHLDTDEPGPIARVVRELGVAVHCIGCAASEADLDVDLLKSIATRDEEGVPRYNLAGDNESLREVLDSAMHGLERPQS